ncbi:MAG: sulfur carrier protein ThiS [Pseudomonadota bacterium]
MQITLNGEQKSVPGPVTVAGLLDHLSLAPNKIAVERNLEIVPKSLYGQTSIAEGDKIEIVQFVGGG